MRTGTGTSSMRIDRDLWRPHWQEGDYPSLPCPHCRAPLNFDNDSLSVRTSTHNVQLVELTDMDEALSDFSAWLTCGHAKCGQHVTVSGICTYNYAYDQKGATITERVFSPKTLLPGPPLITLASDIPKSVRGILRASFNLFWLDSEACANRLRVALELILEDQGFPATDADGKLVSLHRRIDDWHSTYGALSVATSLMAIKWLGNDASHKAGISRTRLFDAYDILSLLLKRLYPPDEREIDELAEDIVRSREH